MIATLKQLKFNTMCNQLSQTFSYCLKNDYDHDNDISDEKTNTDVQYDENNIQISHSNAKMSHTSKKKSANTEKNGQVDISMKSASVEYRCDLSLCCQRSSYLVVHLDLIV